MQSVFFKCVHVLLDQMYERRKVLKVIIYNQRFTISCDGWDVSDTLNDLRFVVIEHGYNVEWTMIFSYPNKYRRLI